MSLRVSHVFPVVTSPLYLYTRVYVCVHFCSFVCAANVQPEPKVPEPVQTGLLVAEPYSWKSLVSGNPILRLRGSGIRAAVLVLPPGYVTIIVNVISHKRQS